MKTGPASQLFKYFVDDKVDAVGPPREPFAFQKVFEPRTVVFGNRPLEIVDYAILHTRWNESDDDDGSVAQRNYELVEAGSALVNRHVPPVFAEKKLFYL